MKWLRAIWEWLWSIHEEKPAPPEPPEYVQRRGHAVVVPVNISAGTFAAEVFVPEEGRGTPAWNRGNIFAVTDGTGNCYEVRGYKIKSCIAGACREPRYELPWGRWRSVRAEWTSKTFRVEIDGTPLSVGSTASWGPVAVVYGDKYGNLLDGCQMRNVKITGAL